VEADSVVAVVDAGTDFGYLKVEEVVLVHTDSDSDSMQHLGQEVESRREPVAPVLLEEQCQKLDV